MLRILGKNRLLPVAVIEDADSAVPLCQALMAGGIDIIEVTLRTDAAIDCIKQIHHAIPEMIIGAGTLINAEVIPKLIDNGVTFAVSPGLNTRIIDACREVALPIIPGVLTPSEIELARNLELNTLKFFPAEAAGGVRMLQAIISAYGHSGIEFIPTGGVNATNMHEYMALAPVVAVGGSWFVARDLIKENKFDQITELTRQALASLEQAAKGQ